MRPRRRSSGSATISLRSWRVPRPRFKINNRVLVTLGRAENDFSVYLGDTDDPLLTVESEEELNEALNQIFKRYFTDFSSISKT